MPSDVLQFAEPSTAAPPSVRCAHCALSVPAGLIEDGAERQFCCSACRAAFGIIHSCGLGGYYTLLDRLGDRAQRVERVANDFAEFDDPAFTAQYVKPGPDGLGCIDLVLEGMHCAACVWLLERLPTVVPGVHQASVSLARSSIEVTFDPGAVRLSRIAEALCTLGYRPHPERQLAARDAQRHDDRRRIVRIAIAGACAGNVMLFSFALYGGFFGGAGSMSAAHEALFRWMCLAVGMLSLAWPGREFFLGAVASLRTRAPSIDTPIALALFAGGVMGLVNTLRGQGEIYFDSLTMLVFLLLVGRFLGGRQQRAAAHSVELLFCLTPTAAHRVDAQDQVHRIPIEAVSIGDLLEVRPGQNVPVDGTVERGHSTVDQSILTGESRHVPVGPGQCVLAGTVNLASTLRVRTQATGRDTRAGRLAQLVQGSAQRRPGIVLFADSIARRFTITVSLLALGTCVAWWFIAPAHAVNNAVSLLIVTCPCALGMAAPLAVGVAIGRGARRGMLIKGGDVFERLARPGLVLLDKTGTLTEGRVRVIRTVGDAQSLQAAAAVERHATHPIAAAIVEAAPAHPPAIASDVRQTDRGGIIGYVNGRRVAVGSESFVRALAPRASADVEQALPGMRADDKTVVLIAIDDAVTGAIALGDRLRADAAASLNTLRRSGWRIGILSGDDQRVVDRFAADLGLEPAQCRGGVCPEDKAEAVRRLAQHGPVVMIGDGVNDAAALAAATVGIAVHGGAEASLAAADVYLSRPGLSPIVELFTAGPRVLSAVRRVFAVSLFYNALAGALAMGGLIHPVIAAALMPISSLSVTAVALRARTFANRPLTCGETAGGPSWK